MARDYKASGPMLDPRGDCRCRRRAHRSIGVALRTVTFHDMSGSPLGSPAFLSPCFTQVRGRPISRSILPFSCRWVPPAPVRSWGSALSRPGRPGPWKARCTRRSREFIGDSSPAASVEGARRLLQIRCKAISALRPPGSSCGASSAVKLVTSWRWWERNGRLP
jgi:hypothetical protein